MDTEQDHKYIKRVLAGDRNAYAVLVDRYKDMVFSLALKLMHNREEAEEIAQDAFVKAYRSLSGFKGNSRFSTWLYRIVYNTAISSLRRKEVEKVQMDEANLPDIEFTESSSSYVALSKEERKKFIARALDNLDAEERFLIIMYYYEDRDMEEMAEITGLTKTNVKVKLHRTRKKMLIFLKSYLKEETYSLL